jgi:hypothetical protein
MLLVLTLVIAGSTITTIAMKKRFAKVRQGPVAQDKEDRAKIFAEEGAEGPAGKWWVSALPERNQRDDFNVPVFVVGTRSLTAHGRFTNLIVAGVTLKNRTPKVVNSVRLGWSLATVTGPSVPVAEGKTELFKVEVESGGTNHVKIPRINFSKITEGWT